jgi:hypothetical protein
MADTTGFGSIQDLIKKNQPNLMANTPGISPVAPGTGVVGGPRRPAGQPTKPNPYQSAFQNAQNTYNQQIQGFETYKKLQNSETSGDLTPNLINKNLSPEAQKWFTETYKEDKDFASTMDQFHANLLALKHNLPTDIDQANESKTASQKIMDFAKSLFAPQAPPPPGQSLAEVRKKQGPGMYQGDIGEK